MKPLIPSGISFIIGVAFIFVLLFLNDKSFIWGIYYIPPTFFITFSDTLGRFLSKTERRQAIAGIDTIYPDFIRVASITWMLAGNLLDIRYFNPAPTDFGSTQSASTNYTRILDDISNCVPVSVCLTVLLDVGEAIGMIIRNALVEYFSYIQQQRRIKKETRDAIRNAEREEERERRGLNRARIWYEKMRNHEERGVPFNDPPPWDE